MDPMPKNRRLAYLTLCWGLFFALLPAIVFYAAGYRISEGAEKEVAIIQTGGISIRSSEGKSTLFVDGREIKKLSALGRNFFVQDFKPGLYEVAVKSPGFSDWTKKILVDKGHVAQSRALLLPEQIEHDLLLPAFSPGDTGTTTDESYEEIADLFKENSQIAPTDNHGAPLGSELNPLEKEKVGIWRKDGMLMVSWTGESEEAPPFFCVYGECELVYPAYILSDPNSHIRFFPGRNDTALLTLSDGIYAVGLDRTPPQLVRRIYEGKDIEFRVFEEGIYIKDGREIYRVEM